jgi:hypothetical protein
MKPGRPLYEPTEKDRDKVIGLSGVGIPHTDIAILLDIDTKTLRKHYRRELDTGSIKANGAVGGKLYKAAMEGNVSAQIFWCKTRMGWKETSKTELSGPNGGPIESKSVHNLTDEELMRIAAGDE